MDEKKLKVAFSNIKKDIEDLQKQVKKAKELATLNEDIKLQLETLKNFNLEGFVENMEEEFKSINKLLQTFNFRFNANVEEFKKFSTRMQKYSNELQFVKKQVQENTAKTLPAEKNITPELEKYEKQFEDMRKGFTEDIKKLIAEITKLKEEKKDSNPQSPEKDFTLAIKEIGNILSEKIDFEVNQLREETTEEIARVYDRHFSEIAELKEEIREMKKLMKEEYHSEIEEKPTNRIERLKSVARWFFIDDDYEEKSPNSKKRGRPKKNKN
ncbi:MAG: hypothetical protein ACOCXG_03390 [Nanoarchaeota archaeon]